MPSLPTEGAKAEVPLGLLKTGKGIFSETPRYEELEYAFVAVSADNPFYRESTICLYIVSAPGMSCVKLIKTSHTEKPKL